MESIRIYVDSLNALNSGRGRGRWIELPMDEENLKSVLQDILKHDEETIICDSENPYNFEADQFCSVLELNEVAMEIERLLDVNKENLVELQMFLDQHNNSDVLNTLRQFVDGEYISLFGVEDEEDLGRAWVEDISEWSIPEDLKNYIDYEKIGQERTNEGWQIYSNYKAAIYLTK